LAIQHPIFGLNPVGILFLILSPLPLNGDKMLTRPDLLEKVPTTLDWKPYLPSGEIGASLPLL